MCATECSVWCHAWRDGRAMWAACNCARFPATWPRVFCELKIMKKVILIHQIIQEKFAYGEFFMLVMIGYIFMFRMVTKMKNSGLEIVAGLTLPLSSESKRKPGSSGLLHRMQICLKNRIKENNFASSEWRRFKRLDITLWLVATTVRVTVKYSTRFLWKSSEPKYLWSSHRPGWLEPKYLWSS